MYLENELYTILFLFLNKIYFKEINCIYDFFIEK